MQRAFGLLLLLWLSVCSSAEQDEAKSVKAVLNKVLTALKELKQGREATDAKADNVSASLSAQILAVNRRLDDVTDIVQEYYQSLNSVFGHWVTAFVPKNGRETSVEIPVCPINTCFNKVMVSKATADSITSVANVKSVTSIEGCSLLCNLRSECAGVRYDASSSLCQLLTNKHPHVEPSGPTEVIWTRTARGLGVCPSSFNIRWNSSKYKFVRRSATWPEGEKYCREMGGSKLAELTTSAEIQQIRTHKLARQLRYWHVGGVQMKGSKEPDSGWKWYRSNISIPTPGFLWKGGKPDNYKGKEHHMNAQNIGLKLYFNDLEDTYRAHGFLCECIEFFL